MKFCEYCGKELENNELCTCVESEQQRAKSSKLMKLTVCIAIPLMVILVGLSVLLGSSKIDPFEYVKVSFDGYDTNGKVVLQFEQDALITEIVGEEPQGNNFQEYLEWDERYTTYSDNIEISYSPEDGLSNDEKVTVTIAVSGGIADYVKGGSKTYTVEGLPEVELVDVFANYQIKFSGVDGDSDIEFYTDSTDAFIQDCCFSIDPSQDFSNNDMIEITITNEDYLAETYQKFPLETSKEYRVSNLGSYITDVSQIPIEEINAISRDYLAHMRDEYVNDSMFAYKNMKLEGTFLLQKRGDDFRHPYSIWIVVSCEKYIYGQFEETLFFPLKFDAPIVQSDGTFDYEMEDGSTSCLSGKTFPDEDINEEYIVNKIQ